MDLPVSAPATSQPAPQFPTNKVDSPSKLDHRIHQAGASSRPLGEQEQESLNKMLAEIGKLVEPLSKIIKDFDERRKAGQNTVHDLSAAQEALEQYKADHPGQQGSIDVSKIEVTLPKNSPLRTGETTKVTLETLMAYYAKEHGEFKLPDLPTTSAGLDSYLDDLGEAIDAARTPIPQQDAVEVKAALEMRTVLYEAMKALLVAYSQLNEKTVSPR